jgi:hypothetical protein
MTNIEEIERKIKHLDTEIEIARLQLKFYMSVLEFTVALKELQNVINRRAT